MTTHYCLLYSEIFVLCSECVWYDSFEKMEVNMVIPTEPNAAVQLLGRAITLIKSARSVYPEGSEADDGWGLAKEKFLEKLEAMGKKNPS